MEVDATPARWTSGERRSAKDEWSGLSPAVENPREREPGARTVRETVPRLEDNPEAVGQTGPDRGTASTRSWNTEESARGCRAPKALPRWRSSVHTD